VTSDTAFEIGGHRIIITKSTEFEHGNVGDISIGVSLEVEGELNADGELVADHNEIEMEGNIEEVGNPPGTVILLGETIHITASTLLHDERDEGGLVPEHFFGLGDLNSGDYVEIDAYLEPDSGKLIAIKLERDDDPGIDD